MVTVGSAIWRKVSPSSARRTVCRTARADCAAPALACAARRRLAAVGAVQSKPTLQLHNPCHQRRVRGQQCRKGFLLRGILSLQTRNDLLRHFGSAGSLSVIITRRRFQSRCHEQVDSCHESRVKRFPAATYRGSYLKVKRCRRTIVVKHEVVSSQSLKLPAAPEYDWKHDRTPDPTGCRTAAGGPFSGNPRRNGRQSRGKS
jgi:hypothetical protein